MTSEHERIAHLRDLYARTNPDVELGIGDDCAVLAPTSKAEVWTIDAAVEDVHFRRGLMSLEQIGFRAFMAAASDIAAMGARARAALSSLVLPTTLRDEELFALASGTARAAESCACSIAGGNLARGENISITTTVLGVCDNAPITRAGARPGDAIFVTGPLGGSALGFRLLEARNQSAKAKPCIDAFLSPRARFDVAKHLSEIATSAIDISDGLAQDAGHLARASQVCLDIHLPLLPRFPNFEPLAKEHNLSIASLVLGGGEDYEILFTAQASEKVQGWATRVGEVRAGHSSVCVRDENGEEIDLRGLGFDHFA